MSAVVSAVKKIEVEDTSERDAMRARGQLLVMMGAAQLVAVANHDFVRELGRELDERGSINRESYEQLRGLLQDELERVSAAAEAMLDEELQAVLP